VVRDGYFEQRQHFFGEFGFYAFRASQRKRQSWLVSILKSPSLLRVMCCSKKLAFSCLQELLKPLEPACHSNVSLENK
jgi:hypothetical protein